MEIPLQSILAALMGQAQARPDLGQKQPTAVLMGRMVQPGDSLASILERTPTGELESGGQALGALPSGLALGGMAKQFRPAMKPVKGGAAFSMEQLLKMSDDFNKPATRTIGNKTFTDAPAVRMAGKGATTATPVEKMYAAMIDPQTGQVINTKTTYRAGDHGGLATLASTMENFNPVRGFVDPATGQAFTEAMLEDLLQQKYFGR